MSTTPTGSPPWLRVNDATTYGGHPEKQDFQGQGAINAQTDLSAAQFLRLVTDLAAIQRVSPFAVLTFTNRDTGTAVPTTDAYLAMAGAGPTGARNGDGDTSHTWLSSYSDAYSVAGDIDITAAVAIVHGTSGTDDWFATCELLDVDANGKNEVVRVRCFDTGGTAVQDVTVTLVVWTGGN